jgi:hypothetical protein
MFVWMAVLAMVSWVSSWANGKPSMATADTFSLHPGALLQQSWDPTVLYLALTRIQPTS